MNIYGFILIIYTSSLLLVIYCFYMNKNSKGCIFTLLDVKIVFIDK